ncbi:MAG: hypothetical protein V3V99_11910 [candidate division Zixibacteria bacterium]
MKNEYIFTALLIICAAGLAFPQSNPVGQSNFLVGGKLYFQSQTGEAYEDEEGESTTTISINPDLGIFFADGFYLGAAAEMQSIDIGKKRRLEYSIGPRIGYFYNSDKYREDNQGALFPYATIYFTYGEFQDHDEFEFNYVKTSIGINLGVVKMISPALGLDIGLKISHDTFEVKGENLAGMDGVTVRLGVGLVGFFGKRFNL